MRSSGTPFSVSVRNSFYLPGRPSLHGQLKWSKQNVHTSGDVILHPWKLAFLWNNMPFPMYIADTCGWTVEQHQWWAVTQGTPGKHDRGKEFQAGAGGLSKWWSSTKPLLARPLTVLQVRKEIWALTKYSVATGNSTALPKTILSTFHLNLICLLHSGCLGLKWIRISCGSLTLSDCCLS